MKIGPLRTLPLRLGLKAASRRNSLNRSRLTALDRKYSVWAAGASVPQTDAFLFAQIHPYPGLGHQMSGWISGLLWARDLGLDYAGGILTQDRRALFAFSLRQPPESSVVPKVVRLFSVNDERDSRSLNVLRGQMHRALDQSRDIPIHFQLALDQARWDQTPAADVLRSAVLAGPYGNMLREIETQNQPYIALHIRRGDVVEGSMGGSTGQSRWVDERWYVDLVHRLQKSPTLKGMEVRAYAQGEPKDFPLLRRQGVTLRVDGDRDTDFVELGGARILVAAPSSFSFTAGLVSRGVVVAKAPWWHRVPDEGRWVNVDSGGDYSNSDLERALSHER